jgi:4-hydroxy-tetrahydrodipicolinate synthase
MAAQPMPALPWAHTRQSQPSPLEDQRRVVLQEWRRGREVLWRRRRWLAAGVLKLVGPMRCSFPPHDNPVVFHDELSEELPVIAFYLYAAAGGTDYSDRTLHDILALPGVIGIKVATLDSVMTFQRIAAVMRDHPDKLLITGEDRFLGYSLMMGARAALIGMGAALTDVQAKLLEARHRGDDSAFVRLSAQLDAFGAATFSVPIDGYIRRMLWALAADGVIPDAACDDPWGPVLPATEREMVGRAVREARGKL